MNISNSANEVLKYSLLEVRLGKVTIYIEGLKFKGKKKKKSE